VSDQLLLLIANGNERIASLTNASVHLPRAVQYTRWAKRWHPFGIGVSSLVRCIIHRGP